MLTAKCQLLFLNHLRHAEKRSIRVGSILQRFFVRQGFSIVPHLWLPEKISTDCVSCPLFRRCDQYAMVMTLREVPRFAAPATTRRVA